MSVGIVMFVLTVRTLCAAKVSAQVQSRTYALTGGSDVPASEFEAVGNIGNGVPGQWTKVGGPAGAIFGGWAGLYATNPQSGDLWHYLGTPNMWERVGGPGKSFVVGWKVYGLSPDGNGVYQYEGTPNKWTRIGNAAGAIYAGGSLICASNPQTGAVNCYNPRLVSWP